MTPIEKAKYLKDLKMLHLTNEKTAIAAGMKPSMVSRYISLLELPKEIQKQVDCGDLPIANPLKAIKKKGNSRVELTTLEPIYYEVLETIGRCVYATQDQTAEYCGVGLGKLRHVINDLAKTKMLEANKEFRPYAYSLSTRGAKIIRRPKPKHFMSANAIHQRLLRNQIELALRVNNPTSRFVARTDCWKMGLYPAIGEHLVSFTHDDVQRRALIIIDDYLMSSERITHSLLRAHDKNKSVVNGQLNLKWSDAVDTLIVYTTDHNNKANHERFVGEQVNIHTKIVVRWIKTIWKFIE